jgi:transcriptional regulator with XRE-family HTH domain
MEPTPYIRHVVAENVKSLRKQRGLSQEALADLANINRISMGNIEQSKNSPTLDQLNKIAEALAVPVSELVREEPDAAKSDIERLDALFPYIRKYQELAQEKGINDIFQDNNGKLLQTLILVAKLKGLGGRMGNDAVDDLKNEYELKTLNCSLQRDFTTHHHLNNDILAKYRKATWIFSAYEGIELQRIWEVPAGALEEKFAAWEDALTKVNHLNNRKIALKLVKKYGTVIWGDAENEYIPPKLPKKISEAKAVELAEKAAAREIQKAAKEEAKAAKAAEKATAQASKEAKRKRPRAKPADADQQSLPLV